MTQNWNDAWVEAGEEDGRYFHALLGVTLGAYAGEPKLHALLRVLSSRCWALRWAHTHGCIRAAVGAAALPLLAGADPKAALLRDLCLPRLRCGAALLLPLPALSCCPAGCITIAGLLYHWFAPGGADCSLNISLITLSLVLCIVLSLITLHPQASVGWGLLGNWRRVWPAAAYRCSRGMQQPNGPQQLRRRLVFPHHRHVPCTVAVAPLPAAQLFTACVPLPPFCPCAGAARLAVPRRLHLPLHNVPRLLGAAGRGGWVG